jgi:hypothetical protein
MRRVGSQEEGKMRAFAVSARMRHLAASMVAAGGETVNGNARPTRRKPKTTHHADYDM